MTAPDPIARFVDTWSRTGAAERANYQLFLSELCDLIGVPRPEGARADASQNAYVFDHPITYNDGSERVTTNWIDLYKRGCFVLEAKQGSDPDSGAADPLGAPRKARRGTAIRGTRGWDSAMLEAKGQAERYARALPTSEGLPPLLIVVDVGHSIEIHADFTRSGRTYVPFPDARTHRIPLADLAIPEIRERLALAWTDPLALDPARRTAKVTREVAGRLARLAKSLEGSGLDPEPVAQFLMRCLFTMFAEDVELIPKNSFTELLKSRRGKVETFPAMVGSLWVAMDRGEYHPILESRLPRFNGQLFASADAPALTAPQLDLLIEAATADWRDVEPAIFGTLLERALDPVERHKLGAHYTPRAYVERLVLPTIVEPLREEWSDTLAAALLLAKEAEAESIRSAGSRKEKVDRVAIERREAKREEARGLVRAFLAKLCSTRVLDPACGTGNFLYVALEHMKRLEAEVRDALIGLGEEQAVFEGAGLTVDPHQFLGIEINPRAAAIADLVLWIGHLQWHFRTVGKRLPAEPILHAYHNIECRDAVLAYDRKEPVFDEQGRPVTRWDGRTMKKHPVTGEDVPDASAVTPVYQYSNPRKGEWPNTDYIIGNPPFIGTARMRDLLGDGYTKSLRKTHYSLSESSDYVMYWWNMAAEIVRAKSANRFGFITTNSLRQAFNRKVIESHMAGSESLNLDFAIPDHPWVESSDGADVRIAMTVASMGQRDGALWQVVRETARGDGEIDVLFKKQTGKIHADITTGVNVVSVASLQANLGLSCPGVQLMGDGFILSRDEASRIGLNSIDGIEKHIRPYRNGRDLTTRPRDVMVIDLFGLSLEEVIQKFPAVYQRLLTKVKPIRETNNRPSYREKWWIFGEPVRTTREALSGLNRYIVTVKTAKHRTFQFVESEIIPDSKLIVFATDSPFDLGVLSSRIHVIWALALGSHLGVGNDPTYVKSASFEKFPFPALTEHYKHKVADIAQALDAHRKRQQSLHPTLTMTDMYNVLEKLRSGEPLTARERVTHEQGLVSVLKQIHDDLDAAVSDAYGWPRDLSDEAILERLVALNAERAAEEARGLVRWLRPEFQNPKGSPTAPAQPNLPIVEAEPEPVAASKEPAREKKAPWPAGLAEQVQAVRAALAARPAPVTPEALAKTFLRARVARVAEVLETLESLGHARALDDGRYARA